MDPRFAPLPGTAVGVLVENADAVLLAEERFGPAEAVVFSRDDASYRWMYVPAGPGVAGEAVYLPVGAKGQRTKRFAEVVLATPAVLRADGISKRFTLVEATVNGGLGSPAVDSFVATELRVLDGTPEYPLDTARTVDAAAARCGSRLAAMADAIDGTFEKAVRSALPGAAEGKREKTLTTYVTWLPEAQRLRVECRYRLTDGEYRYGQGIVPQSGGAAGDQNGLRYGRQVGVTVTLAFEADKTGRLEPAEETAPQPFIVDIPPPGGASGPPRPEGH